VPRSTNSSTRTTLEQYCLSLAGDQSSRTKFLSRRRIISLHKITTTQPLVRFVYSWWCPDRPFSHAKQVSRMVIKVTKKTLLPVHLTRSMYQVRGVSSSVLIQLDGSIPSAYKISQLAAPPKQNTLVHTTLNISTIRETINNRFKQCNLKI